MYRHTLQLQPVPETARSAGKGRSVCVAQSLAQVAAGTVASAVASVLQQRGVASARIRSVGYAASQPVADNGTAEGRARNRRVEIAIDPIKQ